METLKLKFKLSDDFKVGEKYSFDVHDLDNDIFWYKTTAEYLGINDCDEYVFLDKENNRFDLIALHTKYINDPVTYTNRGRYYLNNESIGTFVDYTVKITDKGVTIEVHPKCTHYLTNHTINFEDIARELYKKATRK